MKIPPKRLPLHFLIAFTILFALLLIYPVRNGITRPALVATPILCYALLLTLTWRKKRLRIPLLLLPAALLLPLSLPGHSPDPAAMQTAYIHSLRNYLGTRYIWGGENHIGIDCSGLIRAAMVDAQLHQGITTLNPQLLRQSASLWWNDIAARDMPNGYNGRILPLFSTNSAQSDVNKLHPGDIAVTADGSHVLAFLGNDRWIEADPLSLHVIEWNTTARPGYLDRPFQLLRWRCLATPETYTSSTTH
jgi:cell wall-associated NlpC family hydrolase